MYRMAVSKMTVLSIAWLLVFLHHIKLSGAASGICKFFLSSTVDDCSMNSLRYGKLPGQSDNASCSLTHRSLSPDSTSTFLSRMNVIEPGLPPFMTSSYLSVILEPVAEIFAFALNVNSSTLFDFDIRYKIFTSKDRRSINAGGDWTSYTEDGKKKIFNTTAGYQKYVLSSPFISMFFKINPRPWFGDASSFQLELFGCFLGAMYAPFSIQSGREEMFVFSERQHGPATQSSLPLSQTNYSVSTRYENSLERTLLPIIMNEDQSFHYTFNDSGLVYLTLWTNYEDTFLKVSAFAAVVQGEIRNPVIIAAARVHVSHQMTFRIQCEDTRQILRMNWDFGNGQKSNSAKYETKVHRYTEIGYYNMTVHLENNFYSTTVNKLILIYRDQPISYNTHAYLTRTDKVINATFEFHAFVVLNHFESQSMYINATMNGTMIRRFRVQQTSPKGLSLSLSINLPVMKRFESNLLEISMKDLRAFAKIQQAIEVRAEVENLTLSIFQKFKNETKTPNSFRLWYSVEMEATATVSRGDKIDCQIIFMHFAGYETRFSVGLITNQHYATATLKIQPPYFGTVRVFLKCWNVGFSNIVENPVVVKHFQNLPSQLREMTAFYLPSQVRLHQPVYVKIKIKAGSEFDCEVNFPSTGHQFQLSWLDISSTGLVSGNYTIFTLKNVENLVSGLHDFIVKCSNIHGSAIASGKVLVEASVSGLIVSSADLYCIGETALISWSLYDGNPYSIEVKAKDVIIYTRINQTKSNVTNGNFTVHPQYLSSITNTITVKVYNNFSSVTVNKTISSLPSWKSLNLQFDADVLFRPGKTQPVKANVTFSVLPNHNQSFYHVIWTVNNSTVPSNETQRLVYAVSSMGFYEVSATVIGCWNVTVTRYVVAGPSGNFAGMLPGNADCGVCVGAKNEISSSFLVYGVKNCENVLPESKLNKACPLYNLTTSALAMNITEQANYSLVRVDTKSGIARIESSEIQTKMKDCFIPIIEARGILLSSTTSQVKLTKSLANVLEVFLNFNCPVRDFDISWELFYLGSKTELSSKQEYPIEMFNKTSEFLDIPPYTLESGFYFLQINMTFRRGNILEPRHASKDFFLNVTSRYPIAMIVNGTTATVKFPREYILDGSSSHDPDQPMNSSVAMTYTWICRDMSSPAIDATDLSAVNNLLTIDYSNAPLNSSGCFGKSQGILSRAKKLTIETTKMRENITYEITLVVSKSDIFGIKSAHYTQHLYVDFAGRPQVDIICNENCLSKVSSNNRLSLSGTCEGDGCLEPILFHWMLFKVSNNKEIRVNLLRNQTSSGADKMFFMLKNDVLEPGKNYSVIFQGTRGVGGLSDQKKFFLDVNDISVKGDCAISPNHGEGLLTNFNISCTGWSDVDGPLKYSFFAASKYLSVLLCQGRKESCLTSLQVVPSNGFFTRVEIIISDPLGASMKVKKMVKVVTPLISKKLIEFELKKLSDIVAMSSNDPSAYPVAIQKVSAITSILDFLSKTKDESTDITIFDRIMMREQAINGVLLLKIPGQSRINVIAPVAASLCSFPREITSSSAGSITAALRSMEDDIQNDYKSMSFDEVVKGSKNFLIATAAVIKASSINGVESKTTNTTAVQKATDWTTDKAKDFATALINSTDNFQNVLISKLIVGEDPLLIDTDSLKTLVARKVINDQEDVHISTNIANAVVILPEIESLGPGISDESLDIAMKVSDFNPFFWSNSSKDVKSDVLDFKIIGTKVSNASEYIDLTIQRPNNQQPPWTRNEFKEINKFNPHKVILQQGHSLHIEIVPLNACLSLDVYMKYKARPSKQDFDRKWTVPDFSNCTFGLFNSSAEEMCVFYKNLANDMRKNMSYNASRCFSEEGLIRDRLRHSANCTIGRNPFKIFLSNSDLKEGTYYIGVTTSEDANQGLMSRFSENSRSNCSIINPSIGYNMLVYTANCIYWNETKGWVNDGCKVGPRTTWNHTHCRCNHLTSFASDFLVAPNPIDMSKVLDGFKNLKDNLSVFIFICVLISTYIVLLVLLRRKDREDLKKLGVSVISPVFPKNRYLIVFVTGARKGAGTTANVYVVLNGDQRKSDVRVMRDSSRPIFNRDQINAFDVSYPEDLGKLQSLHLWHDNTGSNPSWFISHVYIEDRERNKRYKFLASRWLAVDEGDGHIEAQLNISDDTDFINFSHLFTTKVARKCSDEHLWLSVVLNRAHSTFTRVQRLTCCLCLLVTTMLTSAMFFSFGGEATSDKFTLKIGSLKFDFRGVIIGIEAGLIAIPVNTIILYLFRNSKPFNKGENGPKVGGKFERTKRNVAGELQNKENQSVLEIHPKCSTERDNDDGVMKKEDVSDSDDVVYHIKIINDQGEIETKKPNRDLCDGNDPTTVDDQSDVSSLGRNAYKNRLPHYCLYIAWFLSFSTVLSSLLVVLFYSMMWGDTKSKQWLLSIFTGFFQSMFVVQPFKLLIVSIVAAAILKMPEKEDEVLDAYTLATRHASNEKQVDTEEKFEIVRPAITKLTETQRLRARKIRLREVRFNHLCRDVTLYIIFLVLLFVVAKGYRDPASYSLARASGIIGSGFKAITDVKSTWQWIQHDMIKGLYSTEWYNGKKIMNGMTPDQASLLVGTVRLRQIRIKPGTCQFPKEFTESTHDTGRTCNDYFSLNDEDETQYDVGWKTRSKKIRRRKRSAFEIIANISQSQSKLVPGYNFHAKGRDRRALGTFNFDIDDSQERLDVYPVENTETLNLTALMMNGKITTKPENWNHKGTFDLKGFPYIGKFAMYSGGGYTASLDSDSTKANLISVSLRYYDWLDYLSRALFAEFSLYNPNSNLFGTAFIFIEFLPHGGAIPSGSLFIFKLYRYVGPNGKLIMASEILVLLLLFCFIYRDIRRMCIQGLKFFKKFWNIVDSTITISVFATLFLWFSRWYQSDVNLMNFRKDPNSYISFQYAAAADEAMVTCLGFIVFFSMLKLIQYLQFFPKILQLTNALQQARGPMLDFMLPFTVSFIAFGGFAFIAFGSKMEKFGSIISTIANQFLMMLGGSNFEALKACDPILGPAYFTVFVICQVFFIFNLLIATLNESICCTADLKEEDQAFIEFMTDRFRTAISRFSRTVSEPPQSSTTIEAVVRQEETNASGVISNRGFDSHLTNLDLVIDKLNKTASTLEHQNEVDLILFDVILKLRN